MSKSWHTQGTLLGTYFLELCRNSESQVLTRRYLDAGIKIIPIRHNSNAQLFILELKYLRASSPTLHYAERVSRRRSSSRSRDTRDSYREHRPRYQHREVDRATEWWRPLLLSSAVSALFMPVIVVFLREIGTLPLIGVWVLGSLMGLSGVTRQIQYGIASVFAIMLVTCLLTPILEPIASWLDVGEQPRRSDVIVILGSGLNCSSGDLSAAGLARLERGLELWRQGYSDTITLTDGAPGLEPGCPSFEAAQRRLIGRLYPDGGPKIVVLEKMLTTRTEAETVAREAKTRGWHSIMLVTSPTHTRRARATFRDIGLKVIAVSSQEPKFDSGMRYPSDRLLSLMQVAREIAGLFKYRAQGWM
jgi:uncharacterized SAM-binding protein YcdF (DUF218 family)